MGIPIAIVTSPKTTVVMPLSNIRSADTSMPATGTIGPVIFSMRVRPALIRPRSRSARTTTSGEIHESKVEGRKEDELSQAREQREAQRENALGDEALIRRTVSRVKVAKKTWK